MLNTAKVNVLKKVKAVTQVGEGGKEMPEDFKGDMWFSPQFAVAFVEQRGLTWYDGLATYCMMSV